MIACLVVAFGLRLAVILNRPEQLTIDRDVYLGIAKGIAEGRGYCVPGSDLPTAFRPPLYPLVLAVGLTRFSPATAVAVVNILAGLITVWLTAHLGRHMRLGRLRFVAALLVAVDPLLLQYSPQPMTEALCACIAIFWLWAVIAAPAITDRKQTIRGRITGIAFGLLVLSRPTFWIVAGFSGLHWLAGLRRIVKAEPAGTARLLRGIAAVGGTVVMITPWVMRNWLVFGTLILTTTHGGYTLLLGNNPIFYNDVVRQPWGTAWSDESQKAWEADLESQMGKAIGSHASEMRRDAWQSKLARRNITEQPVHFIESAIYRVRSLWNTVPQGDASAGINPWIIGIVGWYYACVLTIAFIGMIVVLRNRDRGRWFALYVLIMSVQLAHLFYWTNARMRAPLTPAIALFVAAAVKKSYGPLLIWRHDEGV